MARIFNGNAIVLAAELEQIRAILDTWQAPEQLQSLRNELTSILDTMATPAIWNRASETLRCPHCNWIGVVGGSGQAGRHGVGFRYLEDVGEHRDVEGVEAGDTEKETKFDLMKVSCGVETYPEDNGRFARLECRNCLAESAIPEELEIDFV